MKLVFISLMIFTSVNPLWGMNDEESSKDDIWREQLILLSQNYQRYLPNQYNCVCTKVLHRFFDTKLAQDESSKTNHLAVLITHLERKDWSADDVASHLFNVMVPFKDDYGRSFFSCSIKIIAPYLGWPDCVVCLEAAAEKIFVPCGHLVACASCADSLNGECPVCKEKFIAKEIEDRTDHFCRQCKLEKPNIYFSDCKHLAECESCATDVCIVCSQESQEKIKVFTN